MGSLLELQVMKQALEERIKHLERQLSERDTLIEELNSKLDQYQSVVRIPLMSSGALGVADATSRGPRKLRALGISAEPLQNVPRSLDDFPKETFVTYPKAESTKSLLRNAIHSDDFMKHLSSGTVEEIVQCMHADVIKKDSTIIREGDVGSKLFVMEEGRVEVSKDGQKLTTMGPGRVFGELAILYNCTRTATVRALTACKVWEIERHVFQAILMKSEISRQQQYTALLQSIPIFKSLSAEIINNLGNVLEETHHDAGNYIIRQGARGDTFFIVAKGVVKETRLVAGSNEEELVRNLGPGSYFGEKALVAEEIRTANYIAGETSGAECLVIDREMYAKLMRKLSVVPSPSPSPSVVKVQPSLTGATPGDEYSSIDLSSLNFVATLGVGGFGRVELVQLANEPNRTFALKKLKKHHIVEMRQQEHILNEKNIMSASRCDFIVRLYRTYKDNKYLYMLLEPCLGGELWTLLRDKNIFDDATTRFYMGCVVEAFTYLHSSAIVYRDLKPENLLLDANGYLKLVDFGFAKKIGHGRKTWTFCGTPEYVAPEVILNRGHDVAADLWSLGILMYELLTGSPPFSGSDPMKTYAMILKGINGVDFPRKITKNAQQFIRKLCRNDASERLGYGTNGMKEIYKHKWFEGFNWEALRRRTCKPPHVPQVKSAVDMTNFDTYSADESGIPPDDMSGWDKDF